MVDNSTRVQSGETPSDANDADINDSKLALYRYGRSYRAKADIGADDPVPLFLSDQTEDYPVAHKQPALLTPSRILTGILAVSFVAMGFVLFSVDAARDLIVNSKASLPGVSPVQAKAAVADAIRPVAVPSTPAAGSDQPSRAQIAAAYQEAIKSQTVARTAPEAAPEAPATPITQAAPPAAPVAQAVPPVRRLDRDELNAILKRANSLLAIGDIAAARLLLERAADAQEADAALLLARTYDPEVLGTKDIRAITPDPAQARIWYRKAAELGSQHAQQRLAQMQD
jgi:hypothetical protein